MLLFLILLWPRDMPDLTSSSCLRNFVHKRYNCTHNSLPLIYSLWACDKGDTLCLRHISDLFHCLSRSISDTGYRISLQASLAPSCVFILTTIFVLILTTILCTYTDHHLCSYTDDHLLYLY